ncbi:hypothetical protein PP292_24795, partial [Mycobacteroides abscessus]|nr:hypothetical protein [Mycobacteroides abscessus]MDM1893990.1 hypothetical protein [Mycobacteroides abscessus]
PTTSAPSGPFPFATNLLPRMFGAIAMASGGLRFIDKPAYADIYAGRGAGTIFAEQETGGEAYIPLAPSKRSRSTAILREVMRIFGINSFAGGGISVDELKAMASGIEGQTYGWGAPAGPNSDCSGTQSWLANMISGGTGRFATASQGGALAARGFQMGDPPPGIAAYWIGWKNGGPGGGHTAGTIVDPDG